MFEAKHTIAQLAQLGGVSRRTVRYYVQRGLIPTPLGTGRGAHYGDHHLEALLRVKALQAKGVSLDAILAGESDPNPPAKPQVHPQPNADANVTATLQPWIRVEIQPGVEIHVARDQGLGPATLQQLAEAVKNVLSAQSQEGSHG